MLQLCRALPHAVTVNLLLKNQFDKIVQVAWLRGFFLSWGFDKEVNEEFETCVIHCVFFFGRGGKWSLFLKRSDFGGFERCECRTFCISDFQKSVRCCFNRSTCLHILRCRIPNIKKSIAFDTLPLLKYFCYQTCHII